MYTIKCKLANNYGSLKKGLGIHMTQDSVLLLRKLVLMSWVNLSNSDIHSLFLSGQCESL